MEEHLQSRPMKDYQRSMVNASWTPSMPPGKFGSVCLSFTVGVSGIFVVSVSKGEDLIYLFAYFNTVGLSAQCLKEFWVSFYLATAHLSVPNTGPTWRFMPRMYRYIKCVEIFSTFLIHGTLFCTVESKC